MFLYDVCLHVWRWAVGKAAVGPSHLWMLHPSIVSCRCKYLEKELCLCGAADSPFQVLSLLVLVVEKVDSILSGAQGSGALGG